MLGWMSRAAIRASCWNRLRMPGSASVCGRRIFTATATLEPLVEAVEDTGHAALAQQPADAVTIPDHRAGPRASPPRLSTRPAPTSALVLLQARGRPASGQVRHLGHERERVARGRAPEVPIEGVDVGHHALGLAPTGVGAQIDVPRRLHR